MPQDAACVRIVPFSHLFLYRPAVGRDWDFSLTKGSPRIHCVYSPDDFWIMVGSLVAKHPFGAAGIRGFLGRGWSGLLHNIESYGGHGHDFERAEDWARWISVVVTGGWSAPPTDR